MKDRGADQRWDDVGSRWNFSMMIMGARSSYLMVLISIWGKQEVYNMLSKLRSIFLKYLILYSSWACVLSVEIHGILLASWYVWCYCLMAKCYGMEWYMYWVDPPIVPLRTGKAESLETWMRPITSNLSGKTWYEVFDEILILLCYSDICYWAIIDSLSIFPSYCILPCLK